MLKIGFFGLSHLGICYSAAFASKKFNVIAFDNDNSKIKKLKKNITNIYEKNLKKILNSKLINFSSDMNDLNKCNFIFFSKDVNTDKKNISDFKELRKELENLDKIIDKKIPFIILSQVYPGFSRSLKFKRKLYYQVETLIFGKAMERAIYPERIIIGKKNKNEELNYKLKNVFKKFTNKLLQMNYESAELSKISINLMLISSIMTSNTIASYCEKINACWSDIIDTLKLDKRIGKFAYLRPSPGLSGGNLERDLMNSYKFFKKKNLLKSWIKLDKEMRNWPSNIIEKNLKKKSSILVVGLSYKDGTLSTKNSLALYLYSKLKKKYNLKIYDLFISTDKKLNVKFFDNLDKKKIYDCIIFVNNKYKPIKFSKNYNKNTIFIDPYGFFLDYFRKNNLKYHTIGE